MRGIAIGVIASSANSGITRFVFTKTITADIINTDYNLFTTWLSAAGWDGITPVDATVTIQSGVGIYGNGAASTATALPIVGIPANSVINIVNNGMIVGAGGGGGDVFTPGYSGSPGIQLASIGSPTNIYITNNGTIAGGGGGGGGGGNSTNTITCGGGGGCSLGAGNTGWTRNGSNGTKTSGGSGGYHSGSYYGGYGGNLGSDGSSGNKTSGGQAGAYVYGNRYATWLVTGTRLGIVVQ